MMTNGEAATAAIVVTITVEGNYCYTYLITVMPLLPSFSTLQLESLLPLELCREMLELQVLSSCGIGNTPLHLRFVYVVINLGKVRDWKLIGGVGGVDMEGGVMEMKGVNGVERVSMEWKGMGDAFLLSVLQA
ncbi:hypothetical protein PIB30_089351 [Stylosanthes scabra]|uniref:Uncharacterized protein n=1 Tax=Stylosanthes scabra TaxID=79078 RepID=A0ABU6WTX9_9FABA|nr:hypothetical protein [Stylosanthes scabra]